MTGATVQFADSQAEAAKRAAALQIVIRDDTLATQQDIPAFMRGMVGLPFAASSACKVLGRADNSRFAVFALHNVTPTGEAELVAACDRGMLQRSSLCYLADWIFVQCGVRRLVCRVPAHQTDAIDYLRRLGFRFEGRASRYFSNDCDASVWTLFADECRWLKGLHHGR